MAWTIEISPAAEKELDKISSIARTRILRFLTERVAALENPRQLGQALAGKKFHGIWKYRVGDYRILAEIKDSMVTILVIEVGHRREVYR